MIAGSFGRTFKQRRYCPAALTRKARVDVETMANSPGPDQGHRHVDDPLRRPCQKPNINVKRGRAQALCNNIVYDNLDLTFTQATSVNFKAERAKLGIEMKLRLELRQKYHSQAGEFHI